METFISLCVLISPVWIYLYIVYKKMLFEQNALEKKFISDKISTVVSAIIKMSEDKKSIIGNTDDRIDRVIDNIINKTIHLGESKQDDTTC